MRFRTQKEADAFIRGLLVSKETGKREYLTAKLDTIPAWSGKKRDPKEPEWVPDGSEIEAVYLSYRDATDKQKTEATPAKLSGVKLERISGRLVDVRQCKDGTVQVLFTNGLRSTEGPAFRGPNIDKGILCYLSVGEGLGESVDEIIARVPQDKLDQLRALKGKGRKVTKVVAAPAKQVQVKVANAAEVLAQVNAKRPRIVDVPSVEPPQQEGRSKLR